MPAEIITAQFCADYESTFEVEGSQGATYFVTWDGLSASCTCPVFKYSSTPLGECKHIDKVWRWGCFWNPQWYDGGTRELRPSRTTTRTVPNSTCPACSGPTIAVRIAV